MLGAAADLLTYLHSPVRCRGAKPSPRHRKKPSDDD